MAGLREDRLAALPATFTTGQAELAGLWRRDLYGLRDDGVVSEISRGVYRKVQAPETAHLALLAVAHRAPSAVVCLISALALHELTDEVPAAVQIAVPRGTYRPRIAYPPTEVSEFDPRTFDLGVHEREVAPGERVRIYGPARSVVDVMRLRHRVGEPVALRALRHWVQRPEADLAELLDYARALDVEGPVRQAVEAVLS
ncbi:MAG: type IV toxin-antitoxin system AbiEi family antitoxin domain-containing protein [Pseudonocardiaceae bacterium]